jgi:hypothetical protein
MSNDQFDDLKQFITGAVTKSEKRTFDGLKQFITGAITESEEHTFDDLKQFITGTVAQSERRIKEEVTSELTKKIEGEVKNLHTEMRDGFAGVADALEEINERLDKHDTQDARTKKRPTRLERKVLG